MIALNCWRSTVSPSSAGFPPVDHGSGRVDLRRRPATHEGHQGRRRPRGSPGYGLHARGACPGLLEGRESAVPGCAREGRSPLRTRPAHFRARHAFEVAFGLGLGGDEPAAVFERTVADRIRSAAAWTRARSSSAGTPQRPSGWRFLVEQQTVTRPLCAARVTVKCGVARLKA